MTAVACIVVVGVIIVASFSTKASPTLNLHDENRCLEVVFLLVDPHNQVFEVLPKIDRPDVEYDSQYRQENIDEAHRYLIHQLVGVDFFPSHEEVLDVVLSDRVGEDVHAFPHRDERRSDDGEDDLLLFLQVEEVQVLLHVISKSAPRW